MWFVRQTSSQTFSVWVCRSDKVSLWDSAKADSPTNPPPPISTPSHPTPSPSPPAQNHWIFGHFEIVIRQCRLLWLVLNSNLYRAKKATRLITTPQSSKGEAAGEINTASLLKYHPLSPRKADKRETSAALFCQLGFHRGKRGKDVPTNREEAAQEHGNSHANQANEPDLSVSDCESAHGEGSDSPLVTYKNVS